MSALPAHLLKLRVLRDIPVHEFNTSASAVQGDLSNQKTRLSFLQKLRQKSPATDASVRNKNPGRTRTVPFSSAVWICFAETPEQPVSLWLVYEDAKGEHSVLVDEQQLLESHNAMLSGAVDIKVTGDFLKLKVCCGGVRDHHRFSIQDLHVKNLSQDMPLKKYA